MIVLRVILFLVCFYGVYLVLFSFQVVAVWALLFEACYAGLPVSVSRVVCLRSVDSCLYERSAMAVAKAIGFDVDSVACLGLPGLFSDKICEIIRRRGVSDDDVLIRVGRNGSEKRKIGALREELRRKFARISAGDEVLLETVFDL